MYLFALISYCYSRTPYILIYSISAFIIIFKWTFNLSSYFNLLLFNRDGLLNYLAIFINLIA